MVRGDDDLKTYTNGRLTIVVPSYLRQLKGVLLFEAPAVAVDGRSLKLVSAIAHTIPEYRRVIVETWKSQPKSMSWQGVTQTIDRCGPVDWVPNGFEAFILHTSDTVKVDVPFDYSVIFGDDANPVEVKILGCGQRTTFEELCRRIVVSVRRE